jgi:nicotinate-nucleotide pyrophosphorylase (carboxylating)
MGKTDAAAFDALIDAALAEDVGAGDVTTLSTIGERLQSSGNIVMRSGGVVAGLAIAARVFQRYDDTIAIDLFAQDGALYERGGVTVARVFGKARSLLTAERVALNLLTHLSGIATMTRRYVDAVSGYGARITDTRKTLPGLRALERYAVRAGGGVNHRFDLSAAVLIKDNHLQAAGSVAAAIQSARAHGAGKAVEVECDDLRQVREAVDAGADAILLDNMDEKTMREAVGIAKSKAVIEASGGMTLERSRSAAAAGVDVISVGALTHSAPALDFGLDFIPGPVEVST